MADTNAIWTEQKNISPRQIERAMSEAGKLRAMLGDDDQQLLHDTLEGQTDVFEVIDRIGEDILKDKLLIERIEARLKRLKHRVEMRQNILGRMMDALSIGKALERPLFTLGLEWRRKTIVTDATLLAPQYLRTAPDTAAIGKALRDGTFAGEGAELSNATPSVRIYSQ